jgi:hypothetical protein
VKGGNGGRVIGQLPSVEFGDQAYAARARHSG